MISALNIICFQQMLNLNYPANVQLVMGVFLNLLNADAVDPEWLDGVTFSFNTDVQYVEYAMS
jgi:hypothetical protein